MKLSINDIKELLTVPEKAKHPLDGKGVVAVLPNGFIYYGKLHDEGGHYRLYHASNLRYWKKRDGGLPEFAKLGPNSEDKIDEIGTVYFDTALFFYPAGEWYASK